MQINLLLLLFWIPLPCLSQQALPSSDRSREVIARVAPLLETALSAKGMKLGSPVFIRIFKQSLGIVPECGSNAYPVDPTGELEVWLESGGTWQHFQTYPICYFYGCLGPKTRIGDNQAPEGFYIVGPGQLNPWSKFHLSFNLGYPNSYERAQGWRGAHLMVHGDCVSIGWTG